MNDGTDPAKQGIPFSWSDDAQPGIGTAAAASDVPRTVIDAPATPAGDSEARLLSGTIDWRAAAAVAADTATLDAERFDGAAPCPHLETAGARSMHIRRTALGDGMLCASCAAAADRGEPVAVRGFTLNVPGLTPITEPRTTDRPADGPTDAELGIDPTLLGDLD